MKQLYFTQEHVMLKDMVREFAQNEVKPIAREIDASGRFPSEVIKKMANLGLMGIPWEEKYGGTGMDTMALVIAIEELGKVCPSTAATMMAHTSLGSAPIATILSLSMALRYSLDLDKEASLLDLAVQKVLDDKLRTKDIMSSGMKEVSTSQMGDAIISKLK